MAAVQRGIREWSAGRALWYVAVGTVLMAKKRSKTAARKKIRRAGAKPSRKAAPKGAAPSTPAKWAPRADRGADASIYLTGLHPAHRPVAEALHAAMMRAGKKAASAGRSLSCALKWGVPSYSIDGRMMAQVYDTKAGMNIRFIGERMGEAPRLEDPAHLVDTSGKAPCIRVGTVEEANSEGVRRILESAVVL